VYLGAALYGLFGLYLWRVSREERSEPERIGLSETLGGLPDRMRHVIVPGLFVAPPRRSVDRARPERFMICAGRFRRRLDLSGAGGSLPARIKGDLRVAVKDHRPWCGNCATAKLYSERSPLRV
jgi:hypothetical protein